MPSRPNRRTARVRDIWSGNGQTGALLEAASAADKIAAVRDIALGVNVELAINARTDVFLAGVGEDEDERVEAAVERGNVYLEAGADCVFVPGARSREAIAALVDGIGGPVSVYAGLGVPNVAELQRLGVARVSIGTGPYQAYLALLDNIARSLLVDGDYAPFVDASIPYPEIQDLLSA